MDPLQLIARYYPPDSLAHQCLVRHSSRVAAHAVAVGRRLGGDTGLDLDFLHQAAMLHDIGILHTAAPEIGCNGPLPYLAHAVKGREMLEAEGLPRHALVCERHVGVGLSAAEIVALGLPLPPRDMLPVTLEEQIVAYADLFYSKSPPENDQPRPVARVRQKLGKFGAEKVAVFDAWHARFGG